MAKAQQGGKGKRRQSDKAKAIGDRCYVRAQARHLSNAREQDRRHQANLLLISQGELLPWQQACLERARRREEQGLYAAWKDASDHNAAVSSMQQSLREAFLSYIA